MIKRTLYFGNPAYLNLHNSQLIVRLPEVEKNQNLSENFKKEAAASIPVEDIGIVILDHYQVTITQGLLTALLENNAVVVTCNAKHHPEGLLMTLSGNTIQSERFASQIEASEPLKKQLWAQTIVQKIKNQAAVLKMNNVDNSYLIPLYKNIKSGDSDNCEATAAAYYWKHIFKTLPEFQTLAGLQTLAGFKREREGNSPNNFLNYGYAILRATMARSIVGAGLQPTLGIHHHNRYNAYCLADDLMEPYRPYVDLVVCEILKTNKLNDDIPKEIKVELLKIPAIDVNIDGEKSPLMIATQRTAVSLVKCFEGDYRKIVYPELG